MLAKKNTAIICLSPNNGGMEIDTIKLANKLSVYSNITLIAKKNCFISSQKDNYFNCNIALEEIDFKSSLSYNIIVNVRRILKKYNIKNVIFFGASELKSLYFSFLGLDINLIVRHGTTKSNPKKDWFHSLIYSRVNYHVSICKHLENNVKFIIPFGKKSKSKLIYSSFEFNEPKNIKHNKLTILHVGRIADAKGQIDAIKACEILIDNDIDFELNLVGGFEESYKNEFMCFYEKCTYNDKVNLLGFTNDVEKYIQSSDVFLFPSYGEGLSNAFLEAISNNLLCIAYSNTSFPELIKLGFYFKLAKDRDITDLRKKLLDSVLNIDIERKNISKNNKLVSDLFSLESEMISYKEILK